MSNRGRDLEARPKLSKAEEERLVECVQYLNLEEMWNFCRSHDLPLLIRVERPDGRLRKTSDRDRKDVVLHRILEFALRGKRIGPTVYSHRVVSTDPLPNPITSRTRVHYGQYEKKNQRFIDAMRQLTHGAFRLGMIARLVLRDFWTAGTAPTLRQFADEWLRATAAHTRPRPEGAYLSDLWKGDAGPDWKEVRTRKAKEALTILRTLVRG